MAHVKATAVDKTRKDPSCQPSLEESFRMRLLFYAIFHADHDSETQTAKIITGWMGDHET